MKEACSPRWVCPLSLARREYFTHSYFFVEIRGFSQITFLRFPDFHYRDLSNNKMKHLSNGTFREAKNLEGL